MAELVADYQRETVHGDGRVAGQAAVHVQDNAVAALRGGGVNGFVGPEPAYFQRLAQRGQLRLVEPFQGIQNSVELRFYHAFGIYRVHGDLHIVGGQEARAI